MSGSRLLPVLAALAVLAVPGCKAKDASQSADARTTGTAADASRASESEATATDLAMYPLDMDKMRRWVKASNDLAAAATNNPALGQGMASQSGDSPAQQIAKLNSSATVKDVLRQNGLSPRDYVMIMGSYLQAGMMAAALSANPSAKVPEGQNSKNIEFVKAHKSELEQLFKEAGMSK